MFGRRTITGMMLALVVFGAAATWLLRSTDANVALKRYALASCLSPKLDRGGRYWNITLPLPKGKFVKVTAQDQPGGLAYVEFSDGTTRHITTLRDYVYPHDLRLTNQSNTLWILTSGRGGGVFIEARLYEYNLLSRALMHDLDVDPSDVPTACPVSEAASPRYSDAHTTADYVH